MQIFIPESMKANEEDIKRFFDAMLYKLDLNSHKQGFKRKDITHALTRIKEETAELDEAIGQGNTIAIVLEAADIANFALLASSAALERYSSDTVQS